MARDRESDGFGVPSGYIKSIMEQQKRVEILAEKNSKSTLRSQENQEKVLGTLSDRMSELKVSIATSANTAETLSKKLGAEEAFTREISHDLTMMFNQDESKRLAFSKANRSDKDFMLGQMKEEVLAKYKADERFYKLNKEFISTAMDNVDATMGDIVEESSSMLYPIISGFTRAADDLRHSIVSTVPFMGKYLSDAMIEHYKTGLKEISGHFQQHMSTIMAPLDAIIGPIMAVGKTMFSLGKALFASPTVHEKETAKVQREIRDTLRGQAGEQKKTWLDEKKERIRNFLKGPKEVGNRFLKLLLPLAALAVGTIMGYFSHIKTILGAFVSVIGGPLKKIGPIFTKMEAFFVRGPISKFMFGVGKVFGKLIMPLQMLWEFYKSFDQMKEVFSKEGFAAGLVNLFKTLGASIMSVVLDIPEMIINGFSWLFGSDFRVDFGKEAIMKWVDDATTWVFDNFTVPVFDAIFGMVDKVGAFFGKVAEVFNKIKDGLTGAIGTIFKKVGGLFGMSFGEDVLPETSNTINTTPQNREWVPITSKELDQQRMGQLLKIEKTRKLNPRQSDELRDLKRKLEPNQKVVPSTPSMVDKNKAQADQVNAQISAVKETSGKLDQTNNKMTENIGVSRQIVNNQQIINTPMRDAGIPTDPESMGVLLYNKSWGMA